MNGTERSELNATTGKTSPRRRRSHAELLAEADAAERRAKERKAALIEKSKSELGGVIIRILGPAVSADELSEMLETPKLRAAFTAAYTDVTGREPEPYKRRRS